MHVQGNDIGQDRRMTFEDVRDEVCRVVSALLQKEPGAECALMRFHVPAASLPINVRFEGWTHCWEGWRAHVIRVLR